MADTDEVIKVYKRHVRDLSGREPRRPHRLNPQDIAAARKFLLWCDRRAVDPVKMIALRFRQVAFVTGRRAGPRLADLGSDSLVSYAQREEASSAAAGTEIAVFDQTVRDLTLVLPGQDQVRRRYYFERRQALCMENPMSGGYEPRSHFCPNCPQAPACAAKLNAKWGFDVVSLRLGRLEAVPAAVRKALRGWHGSVSV
jgi:hypothetical protein